MEIKGVMHVHSTYSYDGKESLSDLRDFLMQKGMTFCCVTEHADLMTTEEAQRFIQECRSLSGSQFVFIPGFEVPYKNAHILFIGTQMFLGQKADAGMLRSWSARSALTILAHPVRNRFKLDDVMQEVIDGIEIWNQQYEGKRMPRFHSARLLRDLQEAHPELYATGGLDFHRREHFGSPYFAIDVAHVSSEAILEALQSGSFTFGSDSLRVSSNGLWKGSNKISHKAVSAYSIAVIASGKFVNAVLAFFGLSFPKGLKKLIRSKI